MIFTTYYAALKHYPDFVPICISLFPPPWMKDMLMYRRLSPTLEILTKYKQKQITEDEYTEMYYRDVLDHLDQREVIHELMELSGHKPVVLCCYEGRGRFCHRHLAADWLNDTDGELPEPVVELPPPSKGKKKCKSTQQGSQM